ncbi:hypothetical protein ACVBAX_13015 [Robertmurraya sp. GLU-23]
MNYLIYFDESNKIDQFNKQYSYYGAYGELDTSLAVIVEKIRKIFKSSGSKSELHFTEYTLLNTLKTVI